MTNLLFVLESMRRHWRLLAVVTALCLVAGAAFSWLQSYRSMSGAFYVAEVSFYTDGHESDPVNEYNYELNEDYLASDVRRVIVSSKVAGEVRQEYGPEVTVKTPYWVNRETKSNVYSHYIYAEVSAPTPELALAAAEAVAQKTVAQVQEQLPVSSITVADGPLLKSVTGMAADFGVDGIEEGDTLQRASVSPKTVLIFAFCGFVLPLLVVVARDGLARRLWTRNDVERLLGVPVIDSFEAASADEAASYYRSASVLASLARREGLEGLGACSLGVQEDAEAAGRRLSELADGYAVTCSLDLLRSDEGLLTLSKATAVLLVVRQGSGGAQALTRASELLNGSDLPCVGALLLLDGQRKAK